MVTYGVPVLPLAVSLKFDSFNRVVSPGMFTSRVTVGSVLEYFKFPKFAVRFIGEVPDRLYVRLVPRSFPLLSLTAIDMVPELLTFEKVSKYVTVS